MAFAGGVKGRPAELVLDAMSSIFAQVQKAVVCREDADVELPGLGTLQTRGRRITISFTDALVSELAATDGAIVALREAMRDFNAPRIREAAGKLRKLGVLHVPELAAGDTLATQIDASLGDLKGALEQTDPANTAPLKTVLRAAKKCGLGGMIEAKRIQSRIHAMENAGTHFTTIPQEWTQARAGRHFITRDTGALSEISPDKNAAQQHCHAPQLQPFDQSGKAKCPSSSAPYVAAFAGAGAGRPNAGGVRDSTAAGTSTHSMVSRGRTRGSNVAAAKDNCTNTDLSSTTASGDSLATPEMPGYEVDYRSVPTGNNTTGNGADQEEYGRYLSSLVATVSN
jgi:hypothetical protein